jgi:hypothetical protein
MHTIIVIIKAKCQAANFPGWGEEGDTAHASLPFLSLGCLRWVEGIDILAQGF